MVKLKHKHTYMLRATCWASFGVAMVGSCVALGRLQRGSGGVATGLFAWQWGILTWQLAVVGWQLGPGSVAVGAWQRAWQRGSRGVAVGAWQRGSPGRGSVAVAAWQWAWQYCHTAPGSVAVLPRPGCHAATLRLPRCHAPECPTARRKDPLPHHHCHAEACPVPRRNPPLPHRNSPNMLPLTCMFVL